MIADRVYRTLPNDPLPAEEVSDGSSGDIIFGWVASRTLIDNGRLLNDYLDLKECGRKWPDLTAGILYTRAAMNLAMLFSMRTVGHVAWIQGVNIREASHLWAFQMHDMILKALQRSSPEELRQYQEAHLWVLFLGALFLQQQSSNQIYVPDLDQLRYAELLVLECRTAAIKTWSRMRELLVQFSYCDMLSPHGSTWFEKVLWETNPGSIDF